MQPQTTDEYAAACTNFDVLYATVQNHKGYHCQCEPDRFDGVHRIVCNLVGFDCTTFDACVGQYDIWIFEVRLAVKGNEYCGAAVFVPSCESNWCASVVVRLANKRKWRLTHPHALEFFLSFFCLACSFLLLFPLFIATTNSTQRQQQQQQ